MPGLNGLRTPPRRPGGPPVTPRRTVLAALAAAPVLLAGCAGPRALSPPDVALADVRFLRAGLFQQEVDLLLSVGNPNPEPMPLTGLRVALTVNGQPLARGYADRTATLPRLSTVTIPVRARIDSVDLVRQILTLGNRSGVDYVLSGEAFGPSTGRGGLPFRSTGSLDVLSGETGPALTPL
nr:LEA type 2 family protein [Roseospira navarrensis]